MLRLLVLATCLLPLAGCFPDAQGDFTGDRTLALCNDTVPVCTTTAACVLDQSNYTQGSFSQGATRRFVVRTTTPSIISVELFFVNEQSPGLDSEVTWYEVGCKDRSNTSSGGTDIFAEAGTDRIWKRTQKVVTAGDHLVELFSDAQADYLLRVNVLPAD